jgi:hypothetical protein
VIERDATDWSQTGYVESPDGEDFEDFGQSIALSEQRLLVGDRGDLINNIRPGSAYLFDAESLQWLTKFSASNGMDLDALGLSVAISGPSMIAGAPNSDSFGRGFHSGSIYVFGSLPCTGDCNFDGTVDFSDLVSILFEFGNEDDGVCDSDNTGSINFNDLTTTLFLFGPCK